MGDWRARVRSKYAPISMSPERWRQIEDLFHAISEGEPSARESLLARADPEVRLKVEQLLDQKFAAASVGRPLSEALSGSPQPSIGSQIGPYRVESRLGSGGMGVVYCALDTRLGRRIALKVPNEPFDGRFAREARSIAALNHPNICTVHDVGRPPQGSHPPHRSHEHRPPDR